MKNIITISRQFGAGGSTIGQAVAERLGYYYCDKDMIVRTAIESGNLSPEEIRYYDEKVPKEFGFGQSLFDFYNKPLDERLFNAQREAIRKVAEKGNCVIVGRNANFILKEYDKSLHVFISASERFRLKRMMGKMPDVPEAKVLERLHSVDKARKKYCKYYTHTEFGNAEFYDLSVKSSTLGIDNCVDIICNAAKF
ncbi:Cytidylate kinase [Pseudobutyrivibrio sp. NOR37]|uniref:Cytidylate kinase-like family protein n=1 Tax=Pseudobutyrivibrio xylanivorans TaxID=185007 RepID=A0A6M0LHG0_PSEXY|nr:MULTISPECIES: cytidylate kinase-like family protein [Pseudobutyrivibrio]NEX02008.1 cytidylate kinase-like family protein [Pseudobutyrivibrio xylanivorans]SFR73519.1 Cytidylate kinase [Pseudobutyrivibrio sp. NOR37]